jgi:hypothetical protein
MAGKQELCSGCRDDYYNNAAHSKDGKCWNLSSAKVVTRYRIGWWTAPTESGAFQKVTTNSCHYATGRYAHSERLPDFVTADERTRIESAWKRRTQ